MVTSSVRLFSMRLYLQNEYIIKLNCIKQDGQSERKVYTINSGIIIFPHKLLHFVSRHFPSEAPYYNIRGSRVFPVPTDTQKEHETPGSKAWV